MAATRANAGKLQINLFLKAKNTNKISAG